jgi:hypothetical protein
MAAGLPLVPTHPADPYASAVQAARRQYPIYADAPIVVQKGAPGLPYEDETYMPWSKENPSPGNVLIQTRHFQPKTPEEMQTMIATEGMHYLGAMQPTGQPVNPAWWALKQKYRGAMSDKDMALAQQHWQEESKADPEHARSFDDFMNQSYLDMFFRGYMFPKSQGQEWVDRMARGGWSPQQRAILDQMYRMLTTGK